MAGQTCGRAGIHSLDCTLTLPGGDKHCGFVAVFITVLLWVSAVPAGKEQERSIKMKEDKRLKNVKAEYGEQSHQRDYALNIMAVAIAAQMIKDGVRPDDEKP